MVLTLTAALTILKTKKWALGKKHDKKKKKKLVSKALNNVFLNSPSHLIAIWVTTASFDHSKKKKKSLPVSSSCGCARYDQS